MQRIINIEVAGNRARASSRELGTQGEVAAVTVALRFDSGWNGLAKRLLWRSAGGSSSGYTLLSGPDADGVYTAVAPALPLSEAGKATLTVEGVVVSGQEVVRRVRSVMLTFRVEPNDLEADSAAQAVDASVAEQLASAIEGKAAASHTHTKSEVTDFAHAHAQSDVTGLVSALSGKAAASHTHTKSQITDFAHAHAQSDVTGLVSALSGKAAASHTHTKSEVTDFAHAHAQSDVTGLVSALSGKAAASHTHTASEITDLPDVQEVDASDVTYDEEGDEITVATALDSLFEAVRAERFGEYSGTLLASGWSGSNAPFTQTVSCAAVTAYSHVVVGAAETATDEQYGEACDACLRFTCVSGGVAAKAYGDKPSVNLPIKIGVIK